MPLKLTADRGLLFRITHVDNVPWLLANGLHCANGVAIDPNFVAIGNPDLIDGRAHRRVPLPPGGTLADYIPFYFTPKSPMLLNIKTGYRGIIQRSNEDIVILVSSCRTLRQNRATLLFTDRHAYSATAEWTASHGDLAQLVDWDILQRHDFARSDDYPDKMERYQAEALAHRHIPSGVLLAVGCASDVVKSSVETQVRKNALNIRVLVRPSWYF